MNRREAITRTRNFLLEHIYSAQRILERMEENVPHNIAAITHDAEDLHEKCADILRSAARLWTLISVSNLTEE